MSTHFLGRRCPVCGVELRTRGLRITVPKVQRDGIDAFTLVMPCDECGHRVALLQALGRRDYLLCLGFAAELAS